MQKRVLVLDPLNEIDEAILHDCAAHFAVSKVSDFDEAFQLLSDTRIALLVINGRPADSTIPIFCHRLRDLFKHQGLFILLTIDPEDLREYADGFPGDDYLLRGFSALELRLRLQLGHRQLAHYQDLLNERDFYRRAVMQEEQLSRKLLEQQQYLKGSLVDSVRKHQQLKNANRKLSRQAAYDLLTGLLNRRSLNDRLELEIAQSNANRQPLSGLMLDIDHFKQVNDSHGHQAGDKVLSSLGRILKRELRRNDHAGRYGGEEFFIILHRTILDDALVIAERIRSVIAETEIEWQGNSLNITVSIGLGAYIHDESLASWINRADTALYQAKEMGRNRVVVSA